MNRVENRNNYIENIDHILKESNVLLGIFDKGIKDKISFYSFINLYYGGIEGNLFNGRAILSYTWYDIKKNRKLREYVSRLIINLKYDNFEILKSGTKNGASTLLDIEEDDIYFCDMMYLFNDIYEINEKKGPFERKMTFSDFIIGYCKELLLTKFHDKSLLDFDWDYIYVNKHQFISMFLKMYPEESNTEENNPLVIFKNEISKENVVKKNKKSLPISYIGGVKDVVENLLYLSNDDLYTSYNSFGFFLIRNHPYIVGFKYNGKEIVNLSWEYLKNNKNALRYVAYIISDVNEQKKNGLLG